MGDTALDREWVERALALSPAYWLTTVRRDGRPHATPVWGAFEDGAVWFGTSATTVKARNLARDPECVVHTESGSHVVIVEGRAEDRGPFDPAAPDPTDARAVAAIAAKYRMPAETMAGLPGARLYRVRPREVRAWLEPVFETSRLRISPW